jgi:hypothetical protein
MWGTVAGIVLAATVLALSQSFIETVKKGSGQEKQGKPSQLPEPDRKLKNQASEWKAPLWQEGTAKDILLRVHKMRSKLRK